MKFFFKGQEKEMTNEVWFVPSAVPSNIAEVAVDANAIQLDLQSKFLGLMGMGISSVGAYFVCGTAAKGIGYKIYSVTESVSTNPPIAEEVAAIVSLEGGTIAAPRRGRLRISGIDSTFVDGSYLNGTGVTAATPLTEALTTDVHSGGTTYSPAIYSKKTNTLAKVEVASMAQLLGTARSRLARF